MTLAGLWRYLCLPFSKQITLSAHKFPPGDGAQVRCLKYSSMFKAIKKLFGSKQDRDVATYQPKVDQINEAFTGLSGLSNDELRHKTVEFRGRMAEHLSAIDSEIEQLAKRAKETADFREKDDFYKQIDKLNEQRDEELEVILKDLLPEAFATVKETAARFTAGPVTVSITDHDRLLLEDAKKGYLSVDGDQITYAKEWMAGGGKVEWNMIHYDVQLIGGMVLHDGKIAEMATGEGKTLVATLPAYLNGLSGKGVHVVTVNDYLARRDCEWVGPIMEFLGLTIDCIDKYRPHSPDRVRAYKCDIVYGTNNEFGFDYLRDNMVRSMDDKVQGKHHFAMIDEVDSVLIDDARTPL
ncbi:MAG: hypothetical protein WBA11_19505, partial [Rubrivirga sp.]